MTAFALLYWDRIGPLFSSAERFRDWVQSMGAVAPLAFIATQCLQVVIFVVPGEVPQIAAGYLFGFWVGSLLSVTGILLGSTVSYGLARLLGVPFVRTVVGRDRVEMMRRFSRSTRARALLFLVFLVPGVPKDVFCYAAGLTSMSLATFLPISTAARLPGILGSALLGKAAAQERWLLAGGIFLLALVLFLAGLLFRGRIHALLERLSSRDHGHPGG